MKPEPSIQARAAGLKVPPLRVAVKLRMDGAPGSIRGNSSGAEQVREKLDGDRAKKQKTSEAEAQVLCSGA